MASMNAAMYPARGLNLPTFGFSSRKPSTNSIANGMIFGSHSDGTTNTSSAPTVEPMSVRITSGSAR